MYLSLDREGESYKHQPPSNFTIEIIARVVVFECCRRWSIFKIFVSLSFGALQVSGYCGLLLGSPVILYEIIAFVLPGLTRAERRFLGPIVLGSSVLFYTGIFFSYSVLTPAALSFFVSYAEGAVESLWSIDQYFEFVLLLMFSTGLSFQVRIIVYSTFSIFFFINWHPFFFSLSL